MAAATSSRGRDHVDWSSTMPQNVLALLAAPPRSPQNSHDLLLRQLPSLDAQSLFSHMKAFLEVATSHGTDFRRLTDYFHRVFIASMSSHPGFQSAVTYEQLAYTSSAQRPNRARFTDILHVASALGEAVGEGWMPFWDRTSSRPYYHHAINGATAWTMPHPPTSAVAISHNDSAPLTSGAAIPHNDSALPTSGVAISHTDSAPLTSGAAISHSDSAPPTSGVAISYDDSAPLTSGVGFFHINSAPPISGVSISYSDLAPLTSDAVISYDDSVPLTSGVTISTDNSAPFISGETISDTDTTISTNDSAPTTSGGSGDIISTGDSTVSTKDSAAPTCGDTNTKISPPWLDFSKLPACLVSAGVQPWPHRPPWSNNFEHVLAAQCCF